MSTVVFFTYPDRGHLYPVFHVARQLKERGHRTVFLGLPDATKIIDKEGFESIPVFGDIFPLGSYDAYNEHRSYRGIRRYMAWRYARKALDAILHRLLDGEINALLRELRTDLLVYDNLFPEVGILGHGLGLRVAQFDTNVPWRRERDIPPHVSTIVPDGRFVTKLKIRGAHLKSRVERRAFIAIGAEPDTFRHVTRFAKKYGFPEERIDRSGMLPTVRVPELVMCPREFVEMHSPYLRGDYHFLEAGVDLPRHAPEFPWDRIDPKKTLVYCSLGSLPFVWNRNGNFYREVVRVAQRHPDWQIVLVVGRQANPDDFSAPNVIAVQFAPQLALLAKARLAVVHGGFNTVKECAYFGVPMVLVPFTNDQPGNAARVVYHGLGIALQKERATCDELDRSMERVLGDVRFAERAAAMSRSFRRIEEASPSVNCLERLMSEPRTPLAKSESNKPKEDACHSPR